MYMALIGSGGNKLGLIEFTGQRKILSKSRIIVFSYDFMLWTSVTQFMNATWHGERPTVI